jgi:hypothetical protein
MNPVVDDLSFVHRHIAALPAKPVERVVLRLFVGLGAFDSARPLPQQTLTP